ncbi:hypothetical protein PQU92_09740 [Asticcacaulis sp. BYS171W]|uniref:Uncharacterized protein n=1 Tax=Asticcacaulis aquaticus TaxID=2984212 RepID=A0ABT5HUC9_9CAUL|nr:hypothetical protein [Asticcacaulis aquaticus]MDC7683558.1 hypothetical protein [Asticcacaulis aquaticus]
MSTATLTAPASLAPARTNLIDGSPMFWAGLIFGSMNVVQFAFKAGYATIPGPVFGMMWMAALVTFIMAAFVLKIGSPAAFRARPEVKRFRKAWGMVILSAFATVTIIMSVLGYLHQTALMPFVPGPVALLFYALGWHMAARMSGNGGFNGLSVAGLLAAAGLLAVVIFAGQAWQSLAYAGVLFGLAAVPGLILILQNRN